MVVALALRQGATWPRDEDGQAERGPAPQPQEFESHDQNRDRHLRPRMPSGRQGAMAGMAAGQSGAQARGGLSGSADTRVTRGAKAVGTATEAGIDTGQTIH